MEVNKFDRTWILLLAIVLMFVDPSLVFATEDEPGVLIKAGVVHLGDGQTLQPGMILVSGKQIVAVGAEITAPSGASIMEVAEVTPGFVDAASNVGVIGGTGEVTNEVTPDFAVADAIDLYGPGFRRPLDSGITTVHVVPDTENVVAGFGALLKSAGVDESRWIQRKTGLLISMCNDPTSRNSSRNRPETLYVRQPTNRMGVVWILRARFHAAGKLQDSDNIEQTSADGILQNLIAGAVPCYAVSRTSYDIETLFRIGHEFGFKPILVGGDEAYKVVDLLKQEQATVIFTGLSTGTTGAERTELKWSTLRQLSDAEIPVAIAGEQLLQQARFARRFGLAADQALAAITSRPAEILGVGDRVGKIQVGMDADLVAFNGQPLQATSAIQWVMIDGQVYPSNEEQK